MGYGLQDMDTLIILLITTLAVIFISGSIVLLFALWSIHTIIKIKVPWVKTPLENIVKVFSEINLPENSLMYDLGCGDGRSMFFAEKQGYRGKGYELSLYPFLKCLIKKIFTGSKIEIKRKNFFDENLKDADLVFVFLVDAVMEKLGNKLNKDLKSGAIIVSYGFEIPGWKPEKILNTNPSKFYLYKI